MYSTSQNYKEKILEDSTQHELNIYIDGNKIEPNHIIDFNTTLELFNNNEFCLGCTPEIDIEFEIDKRDLPDTYNEVYVESGLEDEVIPVGKFTIQKPVEDDELKVKIKATDYMKKFEDVKYDGSDLTYPATMLQVLRDICTKIGVELGSTSFLNSDKQISVYDNTVSARTYLSYIAEQAGGIAVIGRDGKLYIRTLGQNIIALDINLFKDYKWGDKFSISKVSYEDGIQDYKFGDNTANTVYINQNNMYIVNSEQVENVYNQIKDFEVYSFEGESIIDPAYDIGDIIIIDDKKVLYQGSLEYAGKFKANIKSKIQAKTEQESTQTKQSNSNKIRRVQSSLNQAEGKIQQLIEETSEQSTKMVQVEKNLDGISQKVENIQNFTKEKNQIENLYLTDVAEGEGYLLKFVVYGNTKLFKSKNITICASTRKRGYGEAIYLTTEDGTEILTEDNQEFIIGEKSFYLKSLKITLDDYLRNFTENGKEYFDTLEIEQDGTIKIVRRIGINPQGDLYVLANEQETILSDKIVLPSQKEQVYYFIEEIAGLNYYAQYIIQNDYSKTFLTKLELGTQITQNAEAVKIAWNQISEFIQMMIIDGQASLAVLNQNDKLLMSLNKEGQHFYNENNEELFGEMGVQKEEDNQYIAFSIEGEYEQTIKDGMAWGIKTQSDNKFHPLFYIKNFQMGAKDSEVGGGSLVLTGCDIILDGFGTGIQTGGVRIVGDPAELGLQFYDSNDNSKVYLEIIPENPSINASINILDKIKFFKNQAGTNSFKVGDDNNYVLLTDDGEFLSNGQNFSCWNNDVYFGSPNKYINFDVYSQSAQFWGNLSINGNVYADNISSDRRIKENIKDSEIKALDIIKKIQHKQFDKKTDKKHYDIGYIAQEMEKIDSNFVSIRPKTDKTDEMYYINELPIIATLSKAIQEQQEEIEELKNITNKQQEQINKILGGK